MNGDQMVEGECREIEADREGLELRDPVIVSRPRQFDAHGIRSVVEALEKFTEAAESWHKFHHGSCDSCDIQCDDLCACIEPARAALKKILVCP